MSAHNIVTAITSLSVEVVVLGILLGVVALALIVLLSRKSSAQHKDQDVRSPKRQGSVEVKKGSVSEMAKAFDQASGGSSPIITGRQQVKKRIRDEVFE